MIGVWQLVLVLLIVFTIFGAGKLPSVMKDVGKGVRNLRQGLMEEDSPKDSPPKKLSTKKGNRKRSSKSKKSS